MTYNDKVVRQFAIMTVVWGIVGMLVGVIIAAQLLWPALNFDVPWLTYSRLRPLHTNAVIFGFTLGAVFTGSYYAVQRLCRVRMFSDTLSRINLWGWNAIIVAAALSFLTRQRQRQGVRRARVADRRGHRGGLGGLRRQLLRHPRPAAREGHVRRDLVLDRHDPHDRDAAHLQQPRGPRLALAVLLGLLGDPRRQHPVVVRPQRRRLPAHHPFLGLMYYFLPKQAGRPIYSHRLSIVHFWSLIFIYMWAGPHHLIYSPLPGWAQTLGTGFSVMLILPSWGGMLNGMHHAARRLGQAAHRPDPEDDGRRASRSTACRTFEGPMMSIKTVNSLSHYTNWTIGHVHSGALGWVAMITVGSMYSLIPRLYGRTEMFSTKLIDVHFWTTTIGIVLYVAAMWIAGVMQGLMWRATNDDGTLTYTFVESLTATYPYYAVRLLGGLLVLGGMFLMAWNVWKTVASGSSTRDVPVMAPAAA
jgi:cytochrome c oxidase cbb3-type subunit I